MRRALLAVWLVALGCGPAAIKGGAVSFKADIAPLFASRCVACHYAPLPTLLDLTTPFDSTHGLVNRTSSWTGARHPVVVVPGHPEQSFLLDKLTATDLDAHTEGAHMPFQVPPVTAAELTSIRQWVTDGANNDAFFLANVEPIFGNAANLGRSIGKCSYCHTATSPNTPDLVHPFDAARGVVNVPANVGGVRVVPGNPDSSVLVQKLTVPLAAGLGAAMPMAYVPFSADEVARISAWIQQGAADN